MMAWLGLVSLFNGISTIVSYLMPKQSLLKNSSDTIILPKDYLGGVGVHTFQCSVFFFFPTKYLHIQFSLHACVYVDSHLQG